MPGGRLRRVLLWSNLLLAGTAAVLLIVRIDAVSDKDAFRHVPRQTTLGAVWTECAAQDLVKEWGPSGTEQVRRSIMADFWLIPAYLVTGLSLGLLLTGAARLKKSWPEKLLGPAMWIWAVGAAFDVVENLLFLRVLPPAREYGWQPSAALFFWLKWAALIIGASLFLAGLLWLVASLLGIRKPPDPLQQSHG